MTRILAIANQKGGVGKTTTSVNLAASLSATKRSVLLVDMDPQGNATMGAGIDKNEVEHSIYDLLIGDRDFDDVVLDAPESGFGVLPANGDLVAAEIELLELPDRESRLRNILRDIDGRYDFVVVDCPPSLNMLTLNALVAAEGVIIPMQCEYYALEGLSALMDTISAISETHNPGLQVEGILRTMYDPRAKLTTEVSHQLFEHFGDRVYRTVVPRNIRLAEAPSYGLPVLAYDRHSRGAIAYLALAGEMLRRQEQQQEAAAASV